MTVYERIDVILAERGISRRKLARMAGIKEATLGSIFAKRPEPFPRKYIASIASALNVSKSYLEGFADNPHDGFELDRIANEISNIKTVLDESANKQRSSMIEIIKHADLLSVSLLSYLTDVFLEYDDTDKTFYLTSQGLDWLGHFYALQRNESKKSNDVKDQLPIEREREDVPEEQ